MRDQSERRDAMVDGLRASGAVRSAQVDRVMREVPRERFLPAGTSPEDAYRDQAVVLAADPGSGFPSSTASQPTVVARMLERLEVRPGHRILEIGTASGYNAALLARLAAPGGHVVTMEIDPRLAEEAARRLAADEAAPAVEVRTADGAAGAPDRAPFDRIEATAGVWDIPRAWFEQLGPGGRMVVPLWLRPGLEVSVAFVRDGDVLRGGGCERCAFLRLLGSGAGPDRYLPAGGGSFVTAESLDEAGAAALVRLLERGPSATEPAPEAPPGWFHRLALADGLAVQVFSTDPPRAVSGLYDPEAGTLALVHDGELAAYGGDGASALAARLRAAMRAAGPFDPADLEITAVPTPTAEAAEAAETSGTAGASGASQGEARGPGEAGSSGRWTLTRPSFTYHLRLASDAHEASGPAAGA